MASKYESLLEVTLNVWFITLCLQEAQLPQRNSTSAAHMDGGGGGWPSSPLPLYPLWLYLNVWSNLKATTYVRQACRP